MPEFIKPVAHWCAGAIELTGILLITGFAAYAVIYGVISLVRRSNLEDIFKNVRQRLGRGLLIGLEFMVAADIIDTVAVGLSFETVGTLAIIVLIRTFLSFALEVELTGKWPWHNG